LTHGPQCSVGAEARRRVKAAGLVEHALTPEQQLRKRDEYRSGQYRAGTDLRAPRCDLVERRLPADAARRAREVAVLAQIGTDRRTQPDRDDVEHLLALGTDAVGDAGYVVGARDETLGETQPGRELEIVAGRAHRDREGDRFLTRAAHADLHRLLGHQPVG